MIVTQQTTQPVATLNLASRPADMRVRFDKRIAQALVVSFPVIVEHELLHRTTKMTLAQGDHLAQAFLFDRPHKTLGICIGL